MEYVLLAIALLVVTLGTMLGLLAPRRGVRSPRLRDGSELRPGIGDDASDTADVPTRGVVTLDLPGDGSSGGGSVAVTDRAVTEPGVAETPEPAGDPDERLHTGGSVLMDLDAPVLDEPAVEQPVLDRPAPTAGRLVRLRSRLSRSQGTLGRGLLRLLSRDDLDEDTWEEIEDSLLTADVGVEATMQIVENLRRRVRVLGTRTPEGLRQLLREELLDAIGESDRSLRTLPHEDRPAVVLVVGVNGTGKTTTCGKLARVLVADGRSVVLGAADTFRAAAAEQLTTWGSRVGAETVRGAEGADPASVAFEAVKAGTEQRVDTVLIDTAGRLHTKSGLMDELGKVKRVLDRQGSVDEVLLVLDATTGQNGLIQARVFAQVVDVTGIVLTKLDGTAKGGIVVAVQRDLHVPVKLIGLGEGPDDLAPFDPAGFVDALLDEEPAAV